MDTGAAVPAEQDFHLANRITGPHIPYSDLAAATEDDSVRTTLLALAQEEAKHKLRFEIEYDEHVLTEN